MAWRARLTRMFLWVSVVAWGLLVGGKLFDLRVLVGAWSASPPESLNLLPYGPRFPVDTGEYFHAAEVTELVRRWVTYDWLRVAVGLVGFVCSIRAISIPFPPPPVAKV